MTLHLTLAYGTAPEGFSVQSGVSFPSACWLGSTPSLLCFPGCLEAYRVTTLNT